jgi:hypothetical protein
MLIGILHFFLVGSTPTKREIRFFNLAVLSLIAAGLLFGTIGWWLGYTLFTGLSLLSIGFGIVVGIAAQLVVLPRRTFMGGVFSIVVIVFLFFLLVLTGPVGLGIVCTYMYTPPALTDANLRVYNACVHFAKAHPTLDSFELTEPNRMVIGDDSFFIDSSSFAGKTKAFFAPNDIDELKKLWRQLGIIGCRKFQKDDNILLFYNDASGVLPASPGVVYFLSSKNPNEIQSELLNTVKPLTKIADDWYMSRNLVLRGRRTVSQICIPKSLIDRSLQIDGIDPNELHKFN